MVPRVGLEPTTLSLEVSCSIQLSYRGMTLVRDTGVEPVSKVWKTFILTAIRIPQRAYYTREVSLNGGRQALLVVQGRQVAGSVRA